MIHIVYHIQNGTVSTMLYLLPNIEEKFFYDARKLEIGNILSDLCKWKGVTIIEAEACPDPIHNIRYKYRSREFWCRGYYVDTAGKDSRKIQQYIQNRLKEDQIAEQLELEIEDPFKKKG